MKKTILSTLVAAFLMSGTAVFAQQNQEQALKSEIRTLKVEKSSLARQERARKKELRKLEAQEVDNFTKQQFAEDFGNVGNVKWQRFNYYDEAIFTNNGVTTKAYYDNQPTLIGTIVDKKFSDLPAKAQKEINKKFPNYVKESVILFDDNEYNETEVLLYDEPFTGPDTYFIKLSNGTKGILLGISEYGDIVVERDFK